MVALVFFPFRVVTLWGKPAGLGALGWTSGLVTATRDSDGSFATPAGQSVCDGAWIARPLVATTPTAMSAAAQHSATLLFTAWTLPSTALPAAGVTPTVPQLFTLDLTNKLFAAGSLFLPSPTAASLDSEL